MNRTRYFQEVIHSKHQQSGASLIELALLLPLIVLVIAGIIDYGSALREVNTISTAAREGARIAASHSRLSPGRPCLAQGKEQTLLCAGEVDSFKVFVADPIATAAAKAACSYINSSGLDGNEWFATPEIRDIAEDGTTFRVITLTLQKTAEAKKCLICWDNLAALIPKSESSFTLEGSCSL